MRSKSMKFAPLACSVLLAFGMTFTCVFGTTALGAKADAAEPQTREYERHLDRTVNDFKNDERVEAAYHSVTWQEGYCSSVGEAIIKIGSGVFNTGGVDKFFITLRSPDDSVHLDDLSIGFRHNLHDQDADVHPYALTELRDEYDILSLSEGSDIATEWVTVTLEVMQADLFNECGEKIGFGAGAADIVTGLHLFCATGIEGSLDIRSIEYEPQRGQKATVVAFDEPLGSAESKKNYNYWWAETQTVWLSDPPQAVGTHVPSQFKFTSAQKVEAQTVRAFTHPFNYSTYEKAEYTGNLDEAYNAVVINMKASGNLTVAPLDENGAVKEGKKLTALTDLAGTKLNTVSAEEFTGVVISLDSLGYKKIKGVQITPDSGEWVTVQSVYLTNMDELVPEENFPKLDADSVSYLSEFDFEYTNVGANYDAAVAECAKFGLDYITSYSSKVGTVENGHLVMNGKGAEYIQMKVRSKTASAGKQYLVIKYRLEDGATLDKFRFDVIDAETDSTVSPVFTKDLACGALHLSAADDNPYSPAGDYEYLIVNLFWTFDAEDDIAGVDLYYTGAGKMMVDEIFYIDALQSGDGVSYESINAALPAYDDAKPLISVSDDTGEAGKEVTLTANVYDYTDGEGVTVTYSVMLGTQSVTVNGNKFTPAKNGTYFVTVTAKDKAGNENSAVYKITVTGESNGGNDGNDGNGGDVQPEKKDGLSGGAIAGIVIGCAAVAAIAAAVVVVIKKRNK